MKALLFSLALLAPALSGAVEGSFIRYLRETAAQGESESQFILGLAHRDGWDGTIRPETLFAKWRELAIEQKDHRAFLLLGLWQREIRPVPKDEATAVQLLQLAADSGDDYARVIFSDMLLEADGVPADWRRGVALLRKSAAAGFAPAQFRLGIVYLVGHEATPQNEIEALAWFIVAAESGSEVAAMYRDEQTQILGREVARLAVLRSRSLLRRDSWIADALRDGARHRDATVTTK